MTNRRCIDIAILALATIIGAVGQNVTLSPTTATLAGGQTQQFTATVTGTGNSGVTWSISPNVGTVNTSGLYTAPATIGSTQTVMVTATSVADGITSASATVTLLPPSASLPSPWLDQDIGVGLPGSASFSSGVFTIQGSGNNADDNTPSNDGYHFVYQPLNGDGEIIARVASMSGGKVGVMIRESLDPAATNVFTGIYQSTVWFFETRTTTGGGIGNPTGGTNVPYWVKAVRQGNNFSGYISPDGVNWTQAGSTVTINMASSAYMGMAASSLSSGTLGTATFDNVTATDAAHDFQISAAPVTGSSTAFTVNVTAGASFAGSIGLSVAGLPTGATASFAPTSLSGSGTSTLTINPGNSTTGQFTLTITAAAPGVSHAATVQLTTPLPSPWLDQDIGVGLPGSASSSNGVFTIQGSGNNADDNTPSNDGYHFVYQPLNGDGQIVARVASMSGGKAGVMIRESLDPAATNAFTGIYQGSVWFFETRATTGSGINNPNASGISVPYWVKAVRQGNNFSGYISPDGVNWTQAGSTVTINMASSAYMGMVATSLSSTTLGTATFDNITVSGAGGTAQVATPTFSPSAGTYSSAQTVTISTTTSGASINYTTDGSMPSETAGTLYSGPITVSATETIQAIAFESGMTDSAVSSASYTAVVGPTISSMSLTSGPGGATVTISGSNFGASQGASTITFNGVNAGIASVWNNTTITVTVPSGAITGNVVITVNGIASSGAPFSVTAGPNIASLSPATAAPSAQITISGSGFGSAQGTGTVWLGTAYAAVVSWSNTQIVATVASNATSGTALVQQSGVSSNAVLFRVNTATVSSVSPASGVPGTQVTITGSGFGAGQGSGQVWLGTAAGVVQSWSDSQVVAVVATGSTSGSAQVLQNGVLSNAVPFTVNMLQLAGVNPVSGAPGTSVTFSGSGFGSSQGSGIVWLGSLSGAVVSWSDTQVVVQVASTAVTGIARIEQNGVWSNAVAFTVPSSGGNGTTILPVMLNMVVGDTHTIQALSSTGQSVTGLTWTSSDPTVVSLSTDDPPILTALAAGHITITAGSASADVTVFSDALPMGTVIWSNPGDGSGVSSIVPAVPSTTGVADVFAFQNDGTVQAITSDGTTAWSANYTLLNSVYPIPDFQGGLVELTADQNEIPNGIVKLDGMTGQSQTMYSVTAPTQLISWPLVHPDGTIFVVQNTNTNDTPRTAIGINPTTGASFSVPFTTDSGCFTDPGQSADRIVALDEIIGGDGYAYFGQLYTCLIRTAVVGLG